MMNGLILSGGNSSRMGQPKALLDYHGQPQIFHLAQLLSPFCDAVFLSCTVLQQEPFISTGWKGPVIIDNPDWEETGPMNGLLSAFQQETAAWLVVGCDYPLLAGADMQQLLDARDEQRIATVFRHPESGYIEPLIGIYEPPAGAALSEWVQQGNRSLRRFLEQFPTRLVEPVHVNHLMSVDTFETYTRFRGINL